ncbi:MAG TPA: adenosylmethionine--8-amino-7-oxononanoate transaminase [Candidatus Acidoferrum sp.]|jgi:adenosylmethionine-8-amino-7-oxononanoate aminotransferase|nr:adenosylmethionine--8-amino-7-oxononanoate transaminase [Candidatus Acidoferrum sp.]
MTAPSWLKLDHVWLPYTQMKAAPLPLPVVSANGVRLLLADGRELIDGVSNWWTACHGHGNPHIGSAIIEQLARMPHAMFGGLAHEPAYRLASRLAALLPGGLKRVFFSESGSVAVEVALKMAAQFWLNQGERRTKFLSFRGGYHGDTFAAMSVCDPEEGMHKLFRGIVPEQFVADLPDTRERRAALEALLNRHGKEIAAVVIEPLVQGAGGMKFHDAGVLEALHNLRKRHGLLLIFDEIFTGFGRTGTFFAMEQSGVVPDIVCLGKALAGGALPLAATAASEEVFGAFLSDDPDAALMHGPTFMAYPLGCAAANASLDLFEREPRLAQVAAIEEQLREDLEPCRGLPGVRDVRVKGAIGVVQMANVLDATGLRARFVEKGVWIKPFSDVIYVTPPFTMEERELSRLTRAIVEVVQGR